MSDLTLYINQDAPNRSNSLVNKVGSGAVPISNLPLVFADIYSTTVQFVNKFGATSSYFPLSGSTATLALGVPGSPALAVATASLVNTSSYYFSGFGLNTTELSASLGDLRGKNYVLELQVIASGSVVTWQNNCTVYRDIVLNAIYPLNINYIVSASFASTALSSSYALSASYAPKQWEESGSNLLWTNKNVAINTGSNNFVDFLVNTNIGGTAMGVQDPSSGNLIVWVNNDGSGNGGTIQVNSIDQTHNAYLQPQQLGIDTGISLNTFQDSFISSSFNFGIGTTTPTQKLQVVGNILCNNITASRLIGTSSWADNSTSSSYAVSASFAPTPVSVSYASNTSTASGIIYGDTYAYNTAFINSYTASITCSNADNGKLINLITGSRVYLTGSLSSTFNCLVYQSGSGTVVITGSDSGVIIRNRQGFKTIGGQYGVVSIVRLPNSDFVLSGDLS